MTSDSTRPQTPIEQTSPRSRPVALWVASALSGVGAVLVGLFGLILTLLTPGLPDELVAFVGGALLFVVSILTAVAAALRSRTQKP